MSRFPRTPSIRARRTRSQKPTLRIESLEPREVPATLDLTNNVLTFTAAAGFDNNVSVTISGGNFVFTEQGETITTTIDGASGSGTNTVTVPTGTVTGIVLSLADGADTIAPTGAIVTAQALTINHAGTGLTIAGPLTTTTGSLSVNNAGTGGINTQTTNISAATFVANTVTGASWAGGVATITTAADHGLAVGQSVTVAGVTPTGYNATATITSVPTSTTFTYALATNPGAYTSGGTAGGKVTATTAVAHNLTVGQLVTVGAVLPVGYNATSAVLSVPTATTFVYSIGVNVAAFTSGGTASSAVIGSMTADVSVSSNNGLTLNAAVLSGGGLVTLRANQDGTGSEGLSQNAGIIATTNTTAAAATIEVNTAAGGTGNASIDSTSIGSNAGGKLTVNSHGGSILYAGAAALTTAQRGTASGGSAPARVISARDYVFTATGAGAIGTDARPIQATSFGNDGNGGSTFALAGGDAGVFLTQWGGIDGTLNGASATGPGTVRFVAASAASHNLFVNGNVAAVNGNIYLASDDNFVVGPGVTIGGTGFSGTVWMQANRDVGTDGQPLTMNQTSSIVTTNTTNVPTGTRTPTTQAVYLDIAGDQGVPSPITLGSITAGNGARIIVNAIPNGIAAEAGTIAMAGSDNLLDAGPTGTIALTAGITVTTNNPAANAVGTPAAPIKVAGGNVVVASNLGNVHVSGAAATSVTTTVTAAVSGQGASTAPSVNLTTTAGALTIPAALGNVNGGPVNLSGAGGVVLNAQVGNATTGAININGPLTGSGNIVLGSAGVTVAQNANSTYDGVISGSEGFAKTGSGTLTLSANQTFTGFAAVGGGTLNLVGSLTNANGAAALVGATLANTTGSVSGPVTIQGTLAPGGSGVAVFNTGALDLFGGGTLAANVNAAGTAGTDFDQVAVTGTANVTNAVLRVLVGATPSLTVGQSFAILANDAADAIVGQFAGGVTISAFDNPRYRFTASYTGGDGNDIVVTLAEILPPRYLDITGGNTLSYTTGAQNDSTVGIAVSGGNYTLTDAAGAITLSTAAIAAGWTGDGTTSVSGPASGITAIALDLSDGTDTLNGLNGGTASVTINSIAALATAGTATTTGNLTFTNSAALTLGGTVNPTGNVTTTGVLTLDLTGTVSPGTAANLAATNITAGSSSLVAAPTVNLTASNGMGSASNRIKTQATTMSVTTGAGGAFVAEADGASVTAIGAGTGTIDIINTTGPLNLTATTESGDIVVTNAVGTLNVAGGTNSNSGNITLASGDDIVVAANLTTGAGTISIAANTDGIGSEGVSQTAGMIAALNTSPSAVTITANTASGGTGNISIDNTSVGGVLGGTLAVNSNGGSILYAGTDTLNAFQQGVQGDGGNAPSRVVKAAAYVFTTGSTGSIGTNDRPMQSNNLAPTNTGTFTAGSGGVYWTDWGTTVFGLASASATGAGSIRVVTANADGHNLNITGPVTAESGSIYLAADDNFTLTSAVGGAGFSGTVYLAGNRDSGNTLNLRMNAGASITTSNATADAVFLEGWNTSGTRAGGITLNNITVGNGGTIRALTAPVATSQGDIVALNTTVLLNAGPTGHVILTAAPQLSAASSIGTAAIPVKVTAGTVVATSNTTSTTTGTTSGIHIIGTGATAFTASIGGPGTHSGNINLFTADGVLTIAGSTSTLSNGTISLTGDDGVVINAPLGNATTGNLTINAGSNVVINAPIGNTTTGTMMINAGSNSATLNTALSLESGQTLAVTAVNGLVVSPTGTVAGTGAAANATPITVQGGTVSPGGTAVGTLNLGNTALGAGSALRMDLNSSSSGDALNVAGSLDVSGAILDLLVNGTLSIGNAFTILPNDGADPVAGQFVGGATINSSNDPRYVFAINYTGGDGNDVVATVSDILTTTVLDVTSVGRVTVGSADGLTNNVSVTKTASAYTITDTAGVITLTPAAIAAGWTGSGTQTVTGPTAGVTGVQFNLNTGDDTLNAIDAGTVPLTITGSGSLNVAGLVSTTGPVTASGMTGITGTGSIQGSTLTLSASNGIGTSSQRLATTGTDLVASAGNGGIFLAEADGANLTATATGTGNIDVVNATGTLNVAGLTSTVNGNISLSSTDAVTLSANLNAGAGTITIAANTDGAGAQGYDQKGASILTTNATPGAASITVNTAAGGTGDAIIGQGIIGSNSGGRITVASNAGNILWSNDPAYTAFNASYTGLSSGGGNSQTLRASVYNLTTTATNASVGTDARPLQFDNFGSDEMAHTEANLTVSTGTGGIYVTTWGVAGNDLTTGTITAQGAGNIRIVTANSGGHNLWVAGPITTGSGSISLYADDEFTMTPSGLVGGAGFSGLVDIIGDRDLLNGQSVNMQAGSAIITSNATADAVRLTSLSAGNGGPGISDLTPQGGVVLGNITVGDGGTITVNAAGGNSAVRQGSIVQRADTLVDAGPNGIVVLLAHANDTTATTNPLNAGNIGANGDIVNLTLLPVKVRAGTVTATTNGTNLNNTGVINVINTISGTFNATTTGNATAFVTLTTEAGALTIGGPTSTGGGAMTLTGAGGVVLNAPLGNGTSGAIGITGPLSGAGNIALGTGGLTVTQDANSTYSGVISGNRAVTKTGTGTLTLAGANTYTAGTTVSAGGLLAGNTTGSATGTGAVTVDDTTTIGGSGAMTGALTVSGTLSLGDGSGTGQLATGPVVFAAAGAQVLALDLNGLAAGTGYDQLGVTGAVDLTGATLNLSAGAAFRPPLGQLFTVLANDGVDPITGTFAGLAQGATLVIGSRTYQVSYIGGDGNDLTLTVTQINSGPPVNTVPGNQTSLEDTDLVFAASTSNLISVDDPEFGGPLKITLTATNGVLTLAGTTGLTLTAGDGTADATMTFVGEIVDLQAALNGLRFIPNANYNGPATITIVSDDQGGTGGAAQTDTDNVAVSITPVNDAPSFTLPTISTTVNEDAPAQSQAGWATAISAGPADEAGQTLTFNLATDNDALFSVLPSIDANGLLTYTPAANANGSATVSVTLRDNGGVANGGVDASAPQTFTITLNPVNDAPSFVVGANQAANEDAGPQTVNGFATAVSAGPANEAGQTLTFDVTTSNDGLFASLPVIDASGILTYTAAPNVSGTATVTVVLRDNGGTALGGVDATGPQTFVINVDPVNDAPTLDPLPDVQIDEDASQQTVSLTGISAGPSDESGQTLTVTATSSDPAIVPNPTVVYSGGPTGSINFTPLLNASGTVTITVTVTDNGGTAAGGVNTFVRTFTLTVNPLNDAPTTTGIPDQTAFEDRAQSIVPLDPSFSDVDNPNATLTFAIVGNTNPALFAAIAINPTTHELTFTPAPEATGESDVTVRVTDAGGEFVEDTFHITVSPANDAPTIDPIANQSITEDDPLQTINLTGISAGPADEAGQTVSITATSSDPLLIPNPLVQFAGSTGTLTFTPVANANGVVTVTVTVSDNGGGSDTTVYTFQVDVAAAPDRPVIDTSFYPMLPAIKIPIPKGTTPAGASIATLVAHVTDVDLGDAKGIAVTGFDGRNGRWEFTVNGGTTWNPIPTVSETAALLLADNALTQVRFIPNKLAPGIKPFRKGFADLTFKVWDQTNGLAAGTLANTTGATDTAYSQVSERAWVAVGATVPKVDANGLPVLKAIREDQKLFLPSYVVKTFLGLLAKETDPTKVFGIAISGTTGTGTWEFKTGLRPWQPLGAVSDTSALILRPTDRVRFKPAANFDGDARLIYHTWDMAAATLPFGTKVDATGVGFSDATETAIADITAVNDAPVLNIAPTINLGTVQSGGQTAPISVSVLLNGAATDVETPSANIGIRITAFTRQMWEYSIDGGANWVRVTKPVYLLPTALIRFTAISATPGTATLKFKAWDTQTSTVAATSKLTETAIVTIAP